MTTKNRIPKVDNLLEKIKDCISNKRYTHTEHAFRRRKEREITLAEVTHVLLTGFEEKRKTRFDERNRTWNYAIRGKTKLDKLDVRVIIAFDNRDLLIITVMYVGNL